MTAPRRAHRWRAGVIAAGWGERLRGGTSTPKPLVSVGGQTLVERVLGSLAEVSPSEVVVIVNEASKAVQSHVASRRWPFAVRWIVETTPSSMHSFLRVVETLADDGDAGPFLLSTVDTVALPGAFASFADRSSRIDADLTLAVAPPGDDDKPLLVRLDETGTTVAALGSSVRVKRTAAYSRGSESGSTGRVLATAGYYAVRATVLGEAEAARHDGVPALRNFFERLLAGGLRIGAVPVAAGVDVDRPGDVRAAETFLRRVET